MDLYDVQSVSNRKQGTGYHKLPFLFFTSFTFSVVYMQKGF